MDITKILSQNSEVFNTSDIVISFMRWIIFTLIRGIAWIANICQEFYQQCFKLLDFTTYEPVKNFLNEFKGAIVVVLAVSIFIIGYMYMFNKEKKSSVVTNFMIGIFVICSSATLLTSINRLMIQSNEYITSTYGESGKASESIISSNLTDLIYVDKKVGLANMKKSEIPRAKLSDDAISSLDFNEVVKPDSDKLTTSEAKDILKQRLVYVPKVDGTTGYVLDDIKDGLLWTDLFSEYYYRYNLNYFTVILTLLSLAIVFLVMGYKVIRLIWELLTSHFLAYIFSGEIASGQATKRIIELVKNVYIVLLYTMVSIKLYLLAVDYVNRVFSENLRGLVLVGIAFAVVDGPLVIEKILGIDAGLQSGIGKLVATMHMVGGAARFVQNARYQSKAGKQMKDLEDAIRNNQQTADGERKPGENLNNNSEAFQNENTSKENMGSDSFNSNSQMFDQSSDPGDVPKDFENSPEDSVSSGEQSLYGDSLNEDTKVKDGSEGLSDYSEDSDWKNGLNGDIGEQFKDGSLNSMEKFVSDMNSKNGGKESFVSGTGEVSSKSNEGKGVSEVFESENKLNNEGMEPFAGGTGEAPSGTSEGKGAREVFESENRMNNDGMESFAGGTGEAPSGTSEGKGAREVFESENRMNNEGMEPFAGGTGEAPSGTSEGKGAREVFESENRMNNEGMEPFAGGTGEVPSGSNEGKGVSEVFESENRMNNDGMEPFAGGTGETPSGTREVFESENRMNNDGMEPFAGGTGEVPSGSNEGKGVSEVFESENRMNNDGMESFVNGTGKEMSGLKDSKKAREALSLEPAENDDKSIQMQKNPEEKMRYENLSGNHNFSDDFKKSVNPESRFNNDSANSRKNSLNPTRRENLNSDTNIARKKPSGERGMDKKVSSRSKGSSSNKVQSKMNRDELNN